MLKRLKDANDLLEESLNGVDTNHPNWDIPIAIIMNDLKPVADAICNICESDELNKLKRTERNRIILEVTRSHMLMDHIPLSINKE